MGSIKHSNYWHGYHKDSNSSSSSGGKSDLDEDYLKYLPPPQYIPRNSLVEISSKIESNAAGSCYNLENNTKENETVFEILKSYPETKNQLSDFDWYYDKKFKESLQSARTKSCGSLDSSPAKYVHNYQLSDSKIDGTLRRKYDDYCGTLIVKERSTENSLFKDIITGREFPVLPAALQEDKNNVRLTLKPKPANWKPPLPPRNNSDAEKRKPPLPPRQRINAQQPRNAVPPPIPPRKRIEAPLYLPPEEIQNISSNLQEVIVDPPSSISNSATINNSRSELLDEEQELSFCEKVWNYISLCKCCKSKCTGSMHL